MPAVIRSALRGRCINSRQMTHQLISIPAHSAESLGDRMDRKRMRDDGGVFGRQRSQCFDQMLRGAAATTPKLPAFLAMAPSRSSLASRGP